MRTWIAALFAALMLAATTAAAQQTQPPQAPAPAPSTESPAAPPPQTTPPAAADSAADGTAEDIALPTSTTGVPRRIVDQIKRLTAAVDAARQSIRRLRDSDSDLARLRSELDQMATELRESAATLRPLLATARQQVESLGPAPAKDAAPEAPNVAAERERLNEIVANIDGTLKTIDLTEVRVRTLAERTTVLRQTLFARNLFERTETPLLPYHWERAARDLPATISFAQYLAVDWLGTSDALPKLGAILLAAIAAWIGLGFTVRWIERMTDSPPPGGRTFIQRAQKIAWLAPARMLPSVAALLIVQGGLRFLGLSQGPWGQVIWSAILGALIAIVVGTLVRAVLSPRDPALRLVNLSDEAASRISWCLVGIVIVYAADLALAEIGRVLVAPLSITVVRTFGASLIYGALLTGLLLTPFAGEPVRSADGTAMLPVTTRLTPWWLKIPLWVLTILILATTLLGYLALGRFIAQQLVLTGTIFVAAGLIYLTIRSIARTIDEPANPIGYMLTTRLRVEPSRLNELAWLAETLLTIVLLAVAVPLVLVQWGFTAADIRDWFASAFFGFEIGQLRISPARILFGILLFIALLFATRVFQRWLRERVLQPRRIEAGISNSIETTVGYSGVALSAILAVSYAGLDITNIAIVAGALSVGIGFGLQSIVNNFVSGLILLVERPVKVGDAIVVGDQEGNVRRISVRSTEIETANRARLIIPNSELITGRVLNKTHRSLMGRGIVRVGANYDADPEKVLALLLACAKAHPQVLTEPPPGAVLDNFGASSLDFFLWFFVADVSRAGGVQSDIRIAIMKAFKEAGIEIPFAQHDIHLRDLDGVRTIINRAAEERAAKARAASAPPDRAAEDVGEMPGEPEPPIDPPPARGG
jgi:small-conductance mechanosensitive channel